MLACKKRAYLVDSTVFLFVMFHVCTCAPFAVTSGKRDMTIADCAVITNAVKWNERILLLQTLGELK